MPLGRRAARTALILGLAAVPASALSPATALAGSSVTAAVEHRDCHDEDPRAAKATFVADGDKFVIQDLCSDGHSAQIQVNVAPWGSPSAYDWKYTVSGGSGDSATITRNQPEDVDIAIRACVSEGATAIACGPWMFGTT